MMEVMVVTPFLVLVVVVVEVLVAPLLLVVIGANMVLEDKRVPPVLGLV
jgi:hypothetical protein